ncbi:MAG: 50S ribosomal protein L35 [SAR324 cluster bacterium]|nr:50S ribosomal protein L35 [SAR324 cluster bacterium]MED5240837.1 50S ribosomal protein L35 [SAR324 cluster bacterium]MED5515399.1 50S ribosomal protein L35 [SAR324 cluster bacterium]MED6340583.1 50S ribosomal protein L35 [SAR324 cluster bacterium]MEE2600204.1 50S ribosomal protein L35 [SAR324 cluster bacterium]
MMKMKTHRGAAKRFKKTGGGGYKRKRAYLRHGMRKRNQDVKRGLRKKAMVSEADCKSVELMLPNG